MIEFDISKAGATTILSCGTTNGGGTGKVGHYVSMNQGLNSWMKDSEKEIYELLSKYAPLPPTSEFNLYEIELRDYKAFGNKEFYRINATYSFKKDRERYSKEIQITPSEAKEVYDIFMRVVKDVRN